MRGPVRSCEDPDPKRRAHPRRHLTPCSQEGGRLPRQTVQYQGEEMNRAGPLITALSQPISPPRLRSLAAPPALLSLSSPSPLFSASSLASSVLFDPPLFLFTFLLCVATLKSRTVLGVSPRVTALERGGAGEWQLCACMWIRVHACACVGLAVVSMPRQGSSYTMQTVCLTLRSPGQGSSCPACWTDDEGRGPC